MPGPGARPGPAPRPMPGGRPTPQWWRDAAGAFTWLTMLVVVALWVRNGGIQELATVGGGLMSLGRLLGLVASQLLLVQVLLMARIPFVERSYGQDELARRHRLVGFWSFNLMVAHLLLTWFGYAVQTRQGLWGTIVDLVANYPGILLAVAAVVALTMVTVTSIKVSRSALRYESWHLLHLYAYLGVGLAVPHQLWSGQDFVGNRPATVFWWTLYAAALGSVLVWRVGVPIARTLRHRLLVAEVRPEGRDATTVVVTGRDLDRLPAAAGQFFQWRFLDAPGASRAHPYSLSAAPDGRSLRITAAHLGDGSSALAQLTPGARVMIEGPYGRLHGGVRTRRKVLLIGAGIGITPMRALLEELPQAPGDVTLVYRAHAQDDVLFADELLALAGQRGARIFTVLGGRATSRESWLPGSAAHLSDTDALRHLVPDLADHDVYICGGPRWMDLVREAALAGGVPERNIHLERFAY
ncbi:MAG: ferric reductase-like transmembrane domain-containing protein [Actinomycetales bacterium]|nr:ferric reductase-like transmembrane domain-containing protein [Actinomycetales bacterium]